MSSATGFPPAPFFWWQFFNLCQFDPVIVQTFAMDESQTDPECQLLLIATLFTSGLFYFSWAQAIPASFFFGVHHIGQPGLLSWQYCCQRTYQARTNESHCKNFFLDFPLFICVYSCHQHHLYLLLNSLFAYVYLFLSISYVATGLTAVVVTCPHALVVIGQKVVSWPLQTHLLLSSLCPIWASLSVQPLINTKLPS